MIQQQNPTMYGYSQSPPIPNTGPQGNIPQAFTFQPNYYANENFNQLPAEHAASPPPMSHCQYFSPQKPLNNCMYGQMQGKTGAYPNNYYSMSPPAVDNSYKVCHFPAKMASQPYHCARKYSEGIPQAMSFPKNVNSFKPGPFNKDKQHGRKRVLSNTEVYHNFDNANLRGHSSSFTNTKHSSTSSINREPSQNGKNLVTSGQQEPKSLYLTRLRERIKNSKDTISIIDWEGHIIEISKDQVGSRYIQKHYEKSTDDEKQRRYLTQFQSS